MKTEANYYYREGTLRIETTPCPWRAVNPRIKAQACVCHERSPDGMWTTGPDPGGAVRGGFCPSRHSGCSWGWAGGTSGSQAHVLTGPGNDRVSRDGRSRAGTGLCGRVREVRISVSTGRGLWGNCFQDMGGEGRASWTPRSPSTPRRGLCPLSPV